LYGVNVSNVSRKARKEGWIQGKTQHLINEKLKNLYVLAEIELQTQHLSATYKKVFNQVVEERLIAAGVVKNHAEYMRLEGEIRRGLKRGCGCPSGLPWA
jgi:hypothetical protein